MTKTSPGALACLFIFFFCSPGFSHPLDLGQLQVSFGGKSITTKLEFNSLAAESFASTRNPSAELLFRSTLGGSSWKADGADCTWQEPRMETSNDQRIILTASADCGTRLTENTNLALSLPFLASASSSYRLIARVQSPSNGTSDDEVGGRIDDDIEQKTFVLSPSATTLEFDLRPRPSFLSFVEMGVAHIGALPEAWTENGHIKIADGIDHILFVVALLLAGGTAYQFMKTITGFTLGHSLTLGLATLGIIRVSGQVVEPIIAFSIAYVALESLLLKEAQKHRWALAGTFGMVHGFGFAAALEELHLHSGSLFKALIGFNLGVELGQILILVLLSPLIFLMSRQPSLQRWAVPTGAFSIAILAAYWAVERILGSV